MFLTPRYSSFSFIFFLSSFKCLHVSACPALWQDCGHQGGVQRIYAHEAGGGTVSKPNLCHSFDQRSLWSIAAKPSSSFLSFIWHFCHTL